MLYQHLFWMYSHPAVYIMILPGMGVISEIMPVYARKAIFGYKAIVGSTLAIAIAGSLVWAHHMFTSGMSDVAVFVFSFLTFVVAIPSAIKVFSWIATLHKGAIVMSPPLFYSLCFIYLFSVGGLTGLVLGAAGTNIHVHDTHFVVGHFHFVMFGGAGFAFFCRSAPLVAQIFRPDVQLQAGLYRRHPPDRRFCPALCAHARAGNSGNAKAILQLPAPV